MSVIEVKNLVKSFGSFKAVNDISFKVEKGEIFGFLGPNGAGKTTTIRCLMDFLRPTSGGINLFGLNLKSSGVEIRKKMGYLSGDVRLYDGWTGEDHIRFLEGIRNQKSVAREIAQKLSLNLKIKFKNLSSGNKQKLGLVLALGFEPELLIMDEPTVGLDPLLQNMIYEVLEEYQKKGTTIFMSSHNLAEVDRLCSNVGVIKEGKLIAIESITALKEKRMHLVNITFLGPYDSQDFQLPNVEIRNKFPEGLILGVKGDINPLVRKLATYNLKELEISHASLEEIFLEFYGQDGLIKKTTQPAFDQKESIPDQPQNKLNDIPKLE